MTVKSTVWIPRTILFFTSFLALPSVAASQEATIVGTVTDPTGAAVASATISITNENTGVMRALGTNEAGQYVAPGLLIGVYNVKVQASGFKAQEIKRVELNEND